MGEEPWWVVCLGLFLFALLDRLSVDSDKVGFFGYESDMVWSVVLFRALLKQAMLKDVDIFYIWSSVPTEMMNESVLYSL